MPAIEDVRAIGVVGGMGPYAGIDLVRKIFDETNGRADHQHLPVVLISFPEFVPDRSTYLLDPSGPSPIPPLREILRRLEQAGCEVAGMPCNTAHVPLILDGLMTSMKEAGLRIRLLNIIEASAEAVRERAPSARRVGVIATSATIHSAVYAAPLASEGFDLVVPDADLQRDLVMPSIFDPAWGLKAHGDPPRPEARQALLETIDHLRGQGAEAMILGCTELCLAVPERSIDGIPVVDSTRSLARALIRAFDPHRLRATAA